LLVHDCFHFSDWSIWNSCFLVQFWGVWRLNPINDRLNIWFPPKQQFLRSLFSQAVIVTLLGVVFASVIGIMVCLLVFIDANLSCILHQSLIVDW
jgi:hypothetical protein